VSPHLIGVLGLVLIFIIGTLRPINLGVLALVMTFVVGAVVVGESPGRMVSGFPIELFVLLVGVTYLFGVASENGTVEWIVDRAVRPPAAAEHAGLDARRPVLVEVVPRIALRRDEAPVPCENSWTQID